MAFREATVCVFAVVLFAVGLPAVSQTVSQQVPAIDGLVTSYVSGHHVPGLSVAVVDRGRVILTQGYGIADVENSVPATADTVYRIRGGGHAVLNIGYPVPLRKDDTATINHG